MARSDQYGQVAPKERQLVLHPTDVGGKRWPTSQRVGWRMRDRMIEWLNGQTKVDGRFSRLSIQEYATSLTSTGPACRPCER